MVDDIKHFGVTLSDFRRLTATVCSMGGRDNGALHFLNLFLKQEYEAKKKKPMRIKYSQEIVTDNPKQSPSTVDCGLFLVNYAEYISRREPINFEQIHMPDLRYKVAYEILKFKLL